MSSLIEKQILSLRRRLECASQSFVRLSMLVAEAMSSPLAVDGSVRVEKAETSLRALLSGLICDVARIHGEGVTVYAVDSGADSVARLEQYNAQLEELERIVDMLSAEAGMKCEIKQEGGIGMSFSGNLNQLDKGDFECPVIFVCGRKASGKTSLIRATAAGERKRSGVKKRGGGGVKVLRTAFFTYVDCDRPMPEGGAVSKCAAEICKGLSCGGGGSYLQVWYCVSAENLKLTPAELEMLRTADDSLVLIVTKTDLLSEGELDRLQADLEAQIDWRRVAYVNNTPDGTVPLEIRKADAVSAVIDGLTEEFQRLLDALDAEIREDADAEARTCIEAYARKIRPNMSPGDLVSAERAMIADIGRCYGMDASENGVAERLLACMDGLAIVRLSKTLPRDAWTRIVSAAMVALGRTAIACFHGDCKMAGEAMQTFFEDALVDRFMEDRPVSAGA